MGIEAVVLTGGASRRMGQDKASLPIDGVPLARSIVEKILASGIPVTVLGREPLEGVAFLPDAEEYEGPLAALSRFVPKEEMVFVCSCDLPFFDPMLIEVLAAKIGRHDAAVPIRNDYWQPLSGLYHSRTFRTIKPTVESGRRSMMGWLKSLDVVEVLDAELGIDPICLTNANTPEEWAKAMERKTR